jgi:hypothetical protein
MTYFDHEHRHRKKDCESATSYICKLSYTSIVSPVVYRANVQSVPLINLSRLSIS